MPSGTGNPCNEHLVRQSNCRRRGKSEQRVAPHPTSTDPPFTLKTSPVMNPACFGTQEQDGRGNLFRRRDPSQRNGGEDLLAPFGISERAGRHGSIHPARRDAVHVNAVWYKLGGKAFCHADDRALGGRVVAVVVLTALAGGRADHHDVPAADFCRTLRRDCSTLSPDSGTCRRPPEVSLTAFDAQPPDLQPAPWMDMDFAIKRPLVRHRMPCIGFLFIGSRLCSTLLSDHASQRRPCASLSLLLPQDGKRTSTS